MRGGHVDEARFRIRAAAGVDWPGGTVLAVRETTVSKVDASAWPSELSREQGRQKNTHCADSDGASKELKRNNGIEFGDVVGILGRESGKVSGGDSRAAI